MLTPECSPPELPLVVSQLQNLRSFSKERQAQITALERRVSELEMQLRDSEQKGQQYQTEKSHMAQQMKAMQRDMGKLDQASCRAAGPADWRELHHVRVCASLSDPSCSRSTTTSRPINRGFVPRRGGASEGVRGHDGSGSGGGGGHLAQRLALSTDGSPLAGALSRRRTRAASQHTHTHRAPTPTHRRRTSTSPTPRRVPSSSRHRPPAHRCQPHASQGECRAVR